jgi:FAD/FMN-containing dehydrogenase
MIFHGLNQQQSEETWRPFINWVTSKSQDYTFDPPIKTITIPARHFWDPDFMKSNYSQFVRMDDRPGAPEGNIFWAGNLGEAGQFLHGYRSAWIPASLLNAKRKDAFVDALYKGSQIWGISLHCNKGLAGTSAENLAAAKDTAMNPAVLDAFALAILGAEGPPAFPGILGHEPDLTTARREAADINRSMDELLKVVPNPGSYVSESDFFEKKWGESFWGTNYQRLAAVKKKYDPNGLFFVHHGVGSEEWSADGFTKVK